MTSCELLDAAERLIEQPRDATFGLWARAATILARQALEGHVAAVLAERAPGSPAADFEAQLILFCEISRNRDLARRARYAWCALSSASHYQGYELPPTATDLRDWMATVRAVVAA